MSTPQAWTHQPLLQGKTIIVSGCASAIGLETTRLIKQLGGEVIGIDQQKIEDYVDELYIADLTDKQSLQALVTALPEHIDGIANLAQLPPTSSADKVIKLNLLAARYLTENMIPKLNENASIVNLASVAGFDWPDAMDAIRASQFLDFANVDDFILEHQLGHDAARAYAFCSEALVVWTLQNRWTWRTRGIRMNALSPGLVDSPMLEHWMDALGERVEEERRVMDRLGTAEDIAPVVAFLLSDMTHWIRGTNIPLDGGMSSHLLSQIHNF